MPPTIREVTSDDWPSFWPLLSGMGTDDDEPVARQRFDELLRDPRWTILVADEGGRLIGYAALQDYGPHLRTGNLHRLARLHDLYVHPDSRRQGVGRVLMEAVTRWGAEHVRYVEWQAGEKTAAPFYEHLGYRGEPCPQPEYPTFVIDFKA
ncbi:MAG TPA: GNAT family N-acetyltransferase [Actinopolymorphaceae bacterium]|jgi:GNAT superfamily N-acetyltransferase